MNNKLWITLAVILLAVGGYLMFFSGSDATETEENTTQTETVEQTIVEEETADDGLNSVEVVVTYTDSGFTPSDVGPITAGTKVVFVNQSSGNFQPASDPHPNHTDVPGFEADELASGERYEFIFNNVGVFGFHNHLDDNQTGTITVVAD